MRDFLKTSQKVYFWFLFTKQKLVETSFSMIFQLKKAVDYRKIFLKILNFKSVDLISLLLTLVDILHK